MAELAAELYDYEMAVEQCQKALGYVEQGTEMHFPVWETVLRIRAAAYWMKLKHEGTSPFQEQALTQAAIELKSAQKILEGNDSERRFCLLFTI